MTTDIADRETRPRPRYARIATATAGAAAAGAAVNALLRSAALAVFDIPQPQFEPLHLSAVAISSIIGAGMGGMLFAFLAQWTTRPTPVFRAVVAVALVLSMIPAVMVNLGDPPRYEGSGVGAGVTLALMHLVVAALTTGALQWADGSADDERMRR